jgi:hypothetical protein
MFSKEKTIVLELHERYSTQEELSKVVVHDLLGTGKQCRNVDDYTILVNNKTYSLSERMFPIKGIVLRQAVLSLIH